MGILGRFKDIMESKVNALLDKEEDPSRVIYQYLRNLQSDLGNVKSETAAVMAEEQRAKRVLDECNAEIEKMQRYTKKAVQAGDDNGARGFLERKALLVQKQEGLKTAYEAACANAVKLSEMNDKIVNDIAQLKSRGDAVKSKLAIAKSQLKINNMNSSITGEGAGMSDFNRIEKKVDKMIDEADAMEEINNYLDGNDIDD